MTSLQTRLLKAGFLVGLPFASSCSLLLGNVRPVEEKARDYSVMDLAAENKDWQVLQTSPDEASHETGSPAAAPDFTYQSKSSGAVISLNSACRQREPSEKEAGSNSDPVKDELRDVIRQITLGFSKLTDEEEKFIELQGRPAVQTTLKGALDGKSVALRAVVFQNRDCFYDVTYLSTPERFKDNEAVFSRFVNSIRLK